MKGKQIIGLLSHAIADNIQRCACLCNCNFMIWAISLKI